MMKMSKIKDSHIRMWHFLQNAICTAAESLYKSYVPETALIAAIIVDAAKEHDIDYFQHENFIYHCQLLKLNHLFIKKQVETAWNFEKSQILWTEPTLETYEGDV